MIRECGEHFKRVAGKQIEARPARLFLNYVGSSAYLIGTQGVRSQTKHIVCSFVSSIRKVKGRIFPSTFGDEVALNNKYMCVCTMKKCTRQYFEDEILVSTSFDQ